MAVVSSIPSYYRSFRTLAAVSKTHRHKSTDFCSSIWYYDFNYHRRNSCRASGSLADTSTSTPNIKRQDEYGHLLPCPHENLLPRNIEHLVVREGGPVVDIITKALDLPPFYSEYGRLLPCPAENFLPRIEHLVVTEGGPILEFITKALNLPPLYVADLIHFGAVFYALICPKPPLTATPDEIKLHKKVTDPSVLKERPSIKGKTVREAQKTFRISNIHDFVEAGTYVRVHVRPKRFPRCYEIDWRSRIIAVTESYVVLNKPAGTSNKPDGTHKMENGGTTDNIEETCVTFASRALELTTPLKTTHQIDNCTEGCVVLARTKDYCSVFHRKIREKQVKKLYLALATAYVPCGVMTHYMRPLRMAPKIISKEFIKGWNMCQLEVLECRKVAWPSALVEKKYGIEDFNWPPNKEFAYECKINLLTGRTHQIRAQLAGCGAPIVGDSMYMPAAIAELTSPGVNPFGNYKKQFESDADKESAAEEWAAKHGKEPGVAIGLQACQISWDDGEHLYQAGPPWWAQ